MSTPEHRKVWRKLRREEQSRLYREAIASRRGLCGKPVTVRRHKTFYPCALREGHDGPCL